MLLTDVLVLTSTVRLMHPADFAFIISTNDNMIRSGFKSEKETKALNQSVGAYDSSRSINYTLQLIDLTDLTFFAIVKYINRR